MRVCGTLGTGSIPVQTPGFKNMNIIQEKTDFGEIWYIKYKQFDFALYSYDDDKTRLYISCVYVKKKYRQKGFGNKILDLSYRFAKSMNFNELILKVKSNTFVYDWYKRNDFNDLSKDNDNYVWLNKKIMPRYFNG